MKEIRALTQHFTVSRPIFLLHIDADNSRVSFNTHSPIYKYTPPDSNECLQILVNEAYDESFSVGAGEYSIDRDSIVKSVISKIRLSMIKFVANNSKMHKPQQSNLYKWVARDMPNNDYFNGILISLYRHLKTFCASDMRAYGNNYEKLADNVMNLLEAMMEKNR